MSDRLQYYFRQKVSEAELNLGFELLEEADRRLASDIGIVGILAGAVPVPHEPVADMSIDLNAPVRAYDSLGQRIFIGTGQTVDCSVDFQGIPTKVLVDGQARWLGVFLRFDRLNSDPRIDGNSAPLYFRQDESFKLIVRQGAAAAAPTKVPLAPDELLICDIYLKAGITQITRTYIDSSRRQAFVFGHAESIRVDSSLWRNLQPSNPTVQSALNSVEVALTQMRDQVAQRVAKSGDTITGKLVFTSNGPNAPQFSVAVDANSLRIGLASLSDALTLDTLGHVGINKRPGLYQCEINGGVLVRSGVPTNGFDGGVAFDGDPTTGIFSTGIGNDSILHFFQHRREVAQITNDGMVIGPARHAPAIQQLLAYNRAIDLPAVSAMSMIDYTIEAEDVGKGDKLLSFHPTDDDLEPNIVVIPMRCIENGIRVRICNTSNTPINPANRRYDFLVAKYTAR